MPDSTLPTMIEEVTPEWLTGVLRTGGTLPADASVAAVRGTSIGDGLGFIGLVVRYEVAYGRDIPGAPATFVAKFPSPDPGSRAVANLYGLYERETRFYNDLSRDAGIDTPVCYFAAYDPDAGQSLVLLEDLRDGEFGDQVGGCTIEEARRAIRAAAQLHAQWWESPALESLAWLPTGDSLVRGAMAMAYDACVEPFKQRFAGLISQEFSDALPSLGKAVVAQLDRFADNPLTLTHGDFRLDNMFFSRSSGVRPVILCDWQSPNRSWGIYDIAYFIAGALDIDERRRHEDELVREYQRTLADAGIDYPLEALWEDYRACLLVMAGIDVVNGATLPANNARGVEVFERMMLQFQAAMSDRRAFELVR